MRRTTSGSKTAVVLDARKNQFYTALYERNKELSSPKLTNADELKSFDFKDTFIIADDTSSAFLNSFGVESVVYTEVNADLGQYLNKIVYDKISNASDEDYLWGKLKPLYLQAPPVTISAKSKIK